MLICLILFQFAVEQIILIERKEWNEELKCRDWWFILQYDWTADLFFFWYGRDNDKNEKDRVCGRLLWKVHHSRIKKDGEIFYTYNKIAKRKISSYCKLLWYLSGVLKRTAVLSTKRNVAMEKMQKKINLHKKWRLCLIRQIFWFV